MYTPKYQLPPPPPLLSVVNKHLAWTSGKLHILTFPASVGIDLMCLSGEWVVTVTTSSTTCADAQKWVYNAATKSITVTTLVTNCAEQGTGSGWVESSFETNGGDKVSYSRAGVMRCGLMKV